MDLLELLPRSARRPPLSDAVWTTRSRHLAGWAAAAGRAPGRCVWGGQGRWAGVE